jgi:hypothetical protein
MAIRCWSVRSIARRRCSIAAPVRPERLSQHATLCISGAYSGWAVINSRQRSATSAYSPRPTDAVGTRTPKRSAAGRLGRRTRRPERQSRLAHPKWCRRPSHRRQGKKERFAPRWRTVSGRVLDRTDRTPGRGRLAQLSVRRAVSIVLIGSHAPSCRLLNTANVTSQRGQCDSTALTPTLTPSFQYVVISPRGSTSNSNP